FSTIPVHDPSTAYIYKLSLHDALPIYRHTASNEKVSKPHDNYITLDCGCIVVDKVTLLSRYCSLALIWESQAYPFTGYIVNLSIAFINNRRNISAWDRKSTGSETPCKENYYLSIGLSL